MAVEKLEQVSITGKLEDLDTFSKDIYIFNDIQIIDAITEIESGRFSLPVSEDNIEEILGFENISTREKAISQKQFQTLTKEFEQYYGSQLENNPNLILNNKINAEETFNEAEKFIDQIKVKSEELNFTRERLEETEQSIRAYSYLKEIDVPMRELNSLEFFSYSVGSLTEDNSDRLKLLYASLPSIIFKLGMTDQNEQVYLIISDNNFRNETTRVLKALNFKEIEGYDKSFLGTPKEITEMLKEKKQSLERDIEVLEAVHKGILRDTLEQANIFYNELVVLASISTIEDYLAFSDKNFYFTGWVAIRQKKELERILSNIPNLKINYSKPAQNQRPPTKLRNNWLFRAFEQLVKMYGIPNYKELDPTPFLALTYIFCFGFMFGDVGQGLVLLIGGIVAEKMGFSLGAVASRVAIASIFFGFMYGSIFGVETIIPAFWLRPMEDTNTLLISAVICGVVMLIIAYIYSLINKRREHEVEAEYFGKNGYSGFAIYLLILVLALMFVGEIPNNVIIDDIIIIAIVILTIFVFLALPLTNILMKKKFSHDVDGQYYVSSFFEVFEMYLSMLSNTLSFIRVGAFALTHVGMFMAFQTIADMVGGGTAGIIILIIGNIFIIGLEGLIDFIQCLRLEFYELFGKYYDGNGIEFYTIQQEIKRLNQI